MANKNLTVHYLKDYKIPDFIIDSIYLHFDLGEDETLVQSVLALKRNPASQEKNAPLVLNGENMELRLVKINGHALNAGQYQVDAEKLTITVVPDEFKLETHVMIKPQENTQLSGLYKSGKNFCTQCESHGFRRITYYLDRPDVLSRFTTTISADKTRYPILLSNGNLIETKELGGNKHWAHWEDPSRKPAYLFALVAGDFDLIKDQFITSSGRIVELRLYLEKGFADQGNYALPALKRAMRWDEERFGREYDLDIYMIVAVSDFNMGAMENKGLNIFNTKYILAKPETATDQDFVHIESVIGHEYFHNWSGNRVTCRDWFQITLKEGLTVFREQLFSIDQTSPALIRIDEVNLIRNRQFLEDSGPNAHPIRPASYIEMNNFYTVTVYHKGSEVIRMLHTLLGEKTFRQAMDLYFSRHDGEAVTTDDFVQAMADTSGRDLTQFKRWYSQSGTPQLDVSGDYNANNQTYTLTVKQSCPPTPGQPTKEPFHLPLSIGLIDSDGKDMALTLQDKLATSATTFVLEVTDKENQFIFNKVMQRPIPSLLRNFSAPVKINFPYTDEELTHLFKHDEDPISQWDAGQQLMTRLLMREVDKGEGGKETELPSLLAEAFTHLLTETIGDYHLLTRLLILPSEIYLVQQKQPAAIMLIHQVRQYIRHKLGKNLQKDFYQHYSELQNSIAEYQLDLQFLGQRSFKNICLSYLVASGEEKYAELAYQQFAKSKNMTDIIGALSALNDSASPRRQQALDEFYQRWHKDPLLINKWLMQNATSAHAATPKVVKQLLSHEAFSIKNPNNVYALICAFGQNLVHVHAHDGEGYQFIADQVITIDGYNPQVAARVVEPLTHWKLFDAERQQMMREQLQRILDQPKISSDIFELVSKSLKSNNE